MPRGDLTSGGIGFSGDAKLFRFARLGLSHKGEKNTTLPRVFNLRWDRGKRWTTLPWVPNVSWDRAKHRTTLPWVPNLRWERIKHWTALPWVPNLMWDRIKHWTTLPWVPNLRWDRAEHLKFPSLRNGFFDQFLTLGEILFFTLY